MGLAKVAIGVLAAALVAGGAYYWLHERAVRSQPALASAPDIDSVEPKVANAPAIETAAKEVTPLPAKAEPTKGELKKPAAPEADPGLALRTGEILEYTADVAKVSNVASLRLQTAERRNFVGKSAWHLQAFAHTQNPLRMVFELDDQFDSYSDAGTLASLQRARAES
jgi:hypothetical protein